MRYCIPLIFSVTLFGTVTASAQSVVPLAEQKLQAEIDKLRAETEKVVIDGDNAVLSPLRGQTSATATISGPGDTAEFAILRRVVTAGAAAKLADAVFKLICPAAGSPCPQPSIIKPRVVIGSTPPTIDQWLWFREHSGTIKGNLESANLNWAEVARGDKAAFPIAGVVALAATVLPMLRTDTTIAGAGGKLEPDELLHATYSALASVNFGLDDADLRMIDFTAATDDLLTDVTPLYDQARANLGEFAAMRSPNDAVIAAAKRLKDATDSYETLRTDLQKPAAGRYPAATILREKEFANSMATRPLLYLTSTRLGMTAMTKKGFFTGLLGEAPAYGYATAVFDYAIVPPTPDAPDGEPRPALPAVTRGTVACTVERQRTSNILTISPDELVTKGASLCWPNSTSAASAAAGS